MWEVSYDDGNTWTSLGVKATGENGIDGENGMNGANGNNGITPKLQINSQTNMWEVSYDDGNTWTSLGIKATGENGSDGENGINGKTPRIRINESTYMWEVSYDNGMTWRSLNVRAKEETAEEKIEAVKKDIDRLITFETDGGSKANWGVVETGYQNVGFDYAYLFKKENGCNAKLWFSTKGTVKKVIFDVYVKSASQNNSGTATNFASEGLAKLTSVKDSDGNEITINGTTDMYALLDAGKTYTVTIDTSNVTDKFAMKLWYSGAGEMYCSNFEFERLETIVETKCLFKSQENNGYFAWPSVARIGENKLLAVSSGYRYDHVDPYGKVVGWISEDDGTTWGQPFVIADTPLDDRDAGVIYYKGKIIVTWFTQLQDYSWNLDWSAYSESITPETKAKYLGANITVSEDGGATWSEPKLIDVFTPHGMIESPDGELVYIGYSHHDGNGFTKMSMIKSSDGINWSAPTVIFDNITEPLSLHEPHAVYAADGTLIVQFRSDNYVYQCELYDGSDEFTALHAVFSADQIPTSLLRLDNGTLVVTYGLRSGAYNVCARISTDNGKTWGEEIMLTDIGFGWDFGYTSNVVLSSGKILTVFYQKQYATDKHPGIMYIVWEIPEN